MEAASAHFCYCTTDQKFFFSSGWGGGIKMGRSILTLCTEGWGWGSWVCEYTQGRGSAVHTYMCVSIAAIINYRTMEIERTDEERKGSRALTGRKENQGTK